MSSDTSIIERNGRVMLLAYDQGFEHGPTDFDEKVSIRITSWTSPVRAITRE